MLAHDFTWSKTIKNIQKSVKKYVRLSNKKEEKSLLVHFSWFFFVSLLCASQSHVHDEVVSTILNIVETTDEKGTFFIFF